MPISTKLIKNVEFLDDSAIRDILKINRSNVDSGCLKQYSNYKDIESFRKSFNDTQKELYLAIDDSDEKILGFMVISKPNAISLIEVDDVKQRHGAGTILIKEAQSAYNNLISKIDSNRPEGITNLLLKNGFQDNKGIFTWSKN